MAPIAALRWNPQCTSGDHTPQSARVVDYTVAGGPALATHYRLVTMFLESARAPAAELAALYDERWKMEIAHDELKTLLREALCVLRSKTPDLVQQEAWGFLLTHFSLRALMREAALGALSRRASPRQSEAE